MNSKVDIVLGAQLGDEGKGRLVDILTPNYDIIARCNSGGNAGHKVVVNGYTYSFHLLPSGILNKNCIAVIGNGCVINLDDLQNEIQNIENIHPNNDLNIISRLIISNRAHIVLPLHKEADSIRENIKKTEINNQSIGTTKQGIGPVYATKALRVGLRMCDLLLPETDLYTKLNLLIDELCFLPNIKKPSIDNLITLLKEKSIFFKPMIQDTVTFLNNSLKKGKRILVEGAQATLLDVDFGVYPYCTATTCTIGAISTGLGISPHYIGEINYVIKTYTTRVGNGAFPTEQINSIGQTLQNIGHEYGTTTGRKRRCGWLDLPMIKWSLLINGIHNANICITKLDVLDTFTTIKLATKYLITNDDNAKVELESFPASLELLSRVEVVYETFTGWLTPTTNIRHYNDLPNNAKIYLNRIQEILQIPIKWIGVGAERDSIIHL